MPKGLSNCTRLRIIRCVLTSVLSHFIKTRLLDYYYKLMGNDVEGLSCSGSVKEIVIMNDLKIDDIIKTFAITRSTISDIDEQIRKHVHLDYKQINHFEFEVFLAKICSQEINTEYSGYFKKWLLNVIGSKFEFSYLLGLILLPLVTNFNSRASKSNIISKYIIDFFGNTKNSLFVAIRYMVEINTDHIYKVLRPLLLKGDESIYFEIWSINRKNRFIQNALVEFKRIYANKIDEYYQNIDQDSQDCEKTREKNTSAAIEQSIFMFFERNLRYLDGVEIRNNLIRDYYNDNKI